MQQHPETVAAYRALLTATNPEGYAGACDAIAAMDQRPDLARINVPTLIIAAGEDQATPVDCARVLAERIDGSTMVVLDNAAHIANVEQPAAFAHAVLSWLRS